MIDNIKTIIGNIFFNCSFVILFEKLFRYTKIKNVEIQKINCGLGELTKKKVIGQAKINNRNEFLFLNKGIIDNNENICIIAPNCSAFNTRPNEIIISPIDIKFECIGKISF